MGAGFEIGIDAEWFGVAGVDEWCEGKLYGTGDTAR
jgi:hypothetical protein